MATTQDRSAMVSVRLSPEEQDLVRAEAEKRGESVSNFIRQAALGRARPWAATFAFNAGSSTAGSGMSIEYRGDGRLVAHDLRPVVGPTS